MRKKKINTIFSLFQKAEPEPRTELDYNSEFELLISVLLSAQATDKSVNKATKSLYAIASNPQQMINLGLESLKTHIKTIGLYNTKAKHIIQTSVILVNKHQGQVPRTFESLTKLPGVGPKTANVILNTLFAQPTIAVDTHVFRVCNRTGIAPGKRPLEVGKKLLAVLDPQFILNAHHWLIHHGRYYCKALKPRCAACLINHVCEWTNPLGVDISLS